MEELVKSEVENFAKFDLIRYAQVWEDADILIEALDINENDNILSIASAGENSIAMLIKNPKKIYAIDLNKNQIYCCEIKKVAYKYLEYDECMELIGVFKSTKRVELYNKINKYLTYDCKEYFERNKKIITEGIINAGKFENYFNIFGKKVLPLIHNKGTREELLKEKTQEERETFYDNIWNNRRWRLLFSLFFSRFVMGRLGRDKAFFRYVKVDVASHILERTKYAITKLDTSKNSYLQYIVRGYYTKEALPVAYRKENFEIIKKNIDKLILMTETVETFVDKEKAEYISKYNLSDIFEYMSDEQMINIFEKIFRISKKGTKIAYWNMLAQRRASSIIDKLIYKDKESKELFLKDKAFFYSDFILEEIK